MAAGPSPASTAAHRGWIRSSSREFERQFGFDKPAHERFLLMITNYIQFDFGESYFRDRPVVDLIIDKMPVSISLGLWTTLLLTYLGLYPAGHPQRPSVMGRASTCVTSSVRSSSGLRHSQLPVRRAA